jgi:hypothetical protein
MQVEEELVSSACMHNITLNASTYGDFPPQKLFSSKSGKAIVPFILLGTG